VFTGWDEMFVPGCIGITEKTLKAKDQCRYSKSFQPGVVYAQRLPVGSTLPTGTLKFETEASGGNFKSYDVSLSPTAGQVSPSQSDDPDCFGKDEVRKTITIDPRSRFACHVELNTVYYANMRAGTGGQACGASKKCYLRVFAW
jgi:hypothetical protein